MYDGVGQASTDWGTWILYTECVNSGWTPGCTVSGTLWQPRPNDPARDCTVHREVFYSRTATPSSHYHPFSHPSLIPYLLPLYPASPLYSALPLNFLQSLPSSCVFFPLSLSCFPFLVFLFPSPCFQKDRNCLLASWGDSPCRPAKADKIYLNTQTLQHLYQLGKQVSIVDKLFMTHR